MAVARLAGSCGLTSSASSSCSAAPANSDRTSTPGSSGSCAATYSLATRFMPSRSGVTSPTRQRRKRPARTRARHRAVDIADRRPGEVAEAAVDVAGQPLELGADRVVGLDALARRRGDLQELDAAAIGRPAFEQRLDAADALRQALRVVEPVDADDEGLVVGVAWRACAAPAMRRLRSASAAKASASMPIGKASMASVRPKPFSRPSFSRRQPSCSTA